MTIAIPNQPSVAEMRVVPVARIDMRFVPRAWLFAQERRAEIDRYFAALQRDKPALWNGRVLLLHEHVLEGELFRGTYFETDFASFIAWRDWGFPDPAIRNCFSLGALRGADGGFVLGVMGAHTANAGKIYFPAGTPEPEDIAGDCVDLAGNIRRELSEETGLVAADYTAEHDWVAVFAGPRVALVKVLQAQETADALRARILAYIASEHEPELAGIHIARTAADLDPMMPPFIVAFLTHAWSAP